MTLGYRRLTPEHIPLLLDLDRRTYPSAFSISAQEYSYYLTWGEIKGTNHSIGIFDGDELIGYAVVIVHPSAFSSGDRIALVFSLAVLGNYRRQAVAPLLARIIREAFACGYSIEGQWRETTSYRMIVRNWQIFRRHGFRIGQLVEAEPFNGERMIQIRFDHIFMRDRLVWGAYQALARMERSRRVLRALPRRMLRKVCQRLPESALPPQLRRLTYLDQPQLAAELDRSVQQ